MVDTTQSFHWLGCQWCWALGKLNGPCKSAGKRDANVLCIDGRLLFPGLVATARPDRVRVDSEVVVAGVTVKSSKMFANFVRFGCKRGTRQTGRGLIFPRDFVNNVMFVSIAWPLVIQHFSKQPKRSWPNLIFASIC